MAVKYNTFGKALAKNDMDTVTIKAMFTATSYTPNADTEVYLSDVVANRASGTTDLTISGFTITADNTDNRTEFDSNDLVTGNITATTNGVVLYIDTGVAATSELLCYLELQSGGTQATFTAIAGVITAAVNANGLFSI